MKKLRSAWVALLPLVGAAAAVGINAAQSDNEPAEKNVEEAATCVAAEPDSVKTVSNSPAAPDSPENEDWRTLAEARLKEDGANRYTELTNDDYRIVAEELGVEVAAMKAVVRIEAGATMQGFNAPGVPVVNFDRSMYVKCKPTSSAKAPASEQVPSGIKHPGQKAEWAQLVSARKSGGIEKANMGTFWGMFQIGGFNYKKCGCKSVAEFVERMSFSEFEQLQLFANFITNTGMVSDLRAKNWSAFARRYNGASYAKRGYHTRMAQAYAKYKAEDKK